jgi:hypothetical protein
MLGVVYGARTQTRVALMALALLAACEEVTGRPRDTALVDLALRDVAPDKVLPGTVITIRGDAFVDTPWGASQLRLRGRVDGDPIDVRLTARYVDERRLEVDVDDEGFELLGGDDGRFEGSAVIEVRSAVDGFTYVSRPVEAGFDLRRFLRPQVDHIQDGGVIFPNEPLQFVGDNLLLRGEGVSVAHFEGCFAREGQTDCAPIDPIDVPIVSAQEFARHEGSFAFVPRIAGIEPGRFEGTVTVKNEHETGIVHETATIPCQYDLERPIIFSSPTVEASLGQFIMIAGAGFVGGGEGDTLLLFDGQFTPDAGDIPIPLEVVLLPEFVDGRTVRYVVNEDDIIGQMFDVRYETGVFSGTLTPQTEYAGAAVAGAADPFEFRLTPVKQVVWLNFLPGYRESLRHFGLRAVDHRIRERVVQVIERDFATVNLEVRTERPDDFALYSQVDIAGPDPNGLGLLGYDNTQGKDVENQRLYDRIGGVNALTQEDGYPGYGGVFIESLFGYSEDPKELTQATRYSPPFDLMFDPFRSDRGGTPVMAADLTEDVPKLTSGQGCPSVSEERRHQISCAVWTLGNLVGTTVSHEIGHSLGLADPYGPFFHNTGNAPDRLMDSDRPFEERAEIDGAGPSRFCDEEYDYLRAILPRSEPYDPMPRPPCH